MPILKSVKSFNGMDNLSVVKSVERGPLLTKRTGVLLQGLVNSRSREIGH